MLIIVQKIGTCINLYRHYFSKMLMTFLLLEVEKCILDVNNVHVFLGFKTRNERKNLVLLSKAPHKSNYPLKFLENVI